MSTPEDKIINKLLLLYLVKKYNEMVGEDLDEDKLMALVYLAQKRMQEEGIRGFTYDWVWKDDE
jgi:hypothetical protein